MFWNKKPKCPITTADKEWVETSLDWINEHIVNVAQQTTIVPDKTHFDWEFNNHINDAYFVLKRVGECYQINTDDIKLGFYSEEEMELGKGMRTKKEGGKGTAGMYAKRGKKHHIWIEIRQLKDPPLLVATMAHELSHYVLIGQKEFRIKGIENEWLTDLLTIAYGFGIFIGNAKFNFTQWQSGDGWGGWGYSSQGYLPQQITAYAMAVIEVNRNPNMPKWINHLERNFRGDFKKSRKYLLSERSS